MIALLAAVSVLLLTGCVTDGDTFVMNGVIWRLHGADALESGQWCDFVPCGQLARLALARLIISGPVSCERRGRSYRRLVGHCTVRDGGEVLDLSAEMVRAGWAIDVPRYSSGAYAKIEADARAHGRGMWSLSGVVSPSEWRSINGRRPR